MIEAFRHQRATTIDDALAALADGATPYAGGTELLAAMKLGLLAPSHLVDLKHVAGLAGVSREGATITVGASTPHAAVEADEGVQRDLPILVSAVRTIGNPRVRWQGTLGGNLCFAEPRSDLVPVLIALDAQLMLRSIGGERRVAAADFVTDAFTVDRRDDELLISIRIDTSGIRYQHYRRIQYMERPTLGVAIVRRDSTWRLSIGSVGYLPLTRTGPDLASFDPAELAAAVEPIEDASGSAAYKRHLVRVTVEDALAAAEVSA